MPEATGTAPEVLEEEFRTFCRYLGAAAPPAAALRYRRAHELGVALPPGTATPGDLVLVRLARSGGLATRLADAHARVFSSGGALRRKLVLTLALLESYGSTAAQVDSVNAPSRAGFVAGMVARMLLFAALVLLSVVVVLPLRLAARLAGSPGGRP